MTNRTTTDQAAPDQARSGDRPSVAGQQTPDETLRPARDAASFDRDVQASDVGGNRPQERDAKGRFTDEVDSDAQTRSTRNRRGNKTD